MKRPRPLLLCALVAFVGLLVAGDPQAGSATVQEAAPEIAHGIKDRATEPHEIEIPGDLEAKFVKLENPLLKLGDASKRVRELQLSLNRELGGQGGQRVIELGRPVRVGPAKGPLPDKSGKTRAVYVSRWDKAFYVHGDWEPCDGKGIKLEADNDSWKETSHFVLPDRPLKVDGVYGQHTYAAVILFQMVQGLPITGEVDVVTLDKLEPMIPTNRCLAAVMERVGRVFEAERVRNVFNKEDDGYPLWVKRCTAFIMTLLILAVSAVMFRIVRMLANSRRILSRCLFMPASSPWFTALVENKVFLCMAQFAPALFIYATALMIFPAPDPARDVLPYVNTFQDWQVYLSRLGLSYISLVFTLAAFAIASAIEDIFDPDPEVDNPINHIIRASKRLIGLAGIVLICAALAGQNPFVIIGGLGAFMAVIILVFRDYLLGLVASVQIITNRVVRLGDWIAMPKYNADGNVTEMSLTFIKVQNFDKTISTIPTHAVLSESFRNWTGMQTAGGRRIKRSVLIDIRSIQVCTPDMVDRFEKVELIRDYIRGKKAELEGYNREHDVEASPVNCRQLTNIGTFRAYLEEYLRNHPGLSDEMTFLVRHLEPTKNGLPIEVYAFSKETALGKYEAVQADIFDHVLAILPEFDLQAFQEMTDINPNLAEDSPRDGHRQIGMGNAG